MVKLQKYFSISKYPKTFWIGWTNKLIKTIITIVTGTITKCIWLLFLILVVLHEISVESTNRFSINKLCKWGISSNFILWNQI